MKKNVTFMWCSNDMFHYLLEPEFVTLASLKVRSGYIVGEKPHRGTNWRETVVGIKCIIVRGVTSTLVAEHAALVALTGRRRRRVVASVSGCGRGEAPGGRRRRGRRGRGRGGAGDVEPSSGVVGVAPPGGAGGVGGVGGCCSRRNGTCRKGG